VDGTHRFGDSSHRRWATTGSAEEPVLLPSGPSRRPGGLSTAVVGVPSFSPGSVRRYFFCRPTDLRPRSSAECGGFVRKARSAFRDDERASLFRTMPDTVRLNADVPRPTNADNIPAGLKLAISADSRSGRRYIPAVNGGTLAPRSNRGNLMTRSALERSVKSVAAIVVERETPYTEVDGDGRTDRWERRASTSAAVSADERSIRTASSVRSTATGRGIAVRTAGGGLPGRRRRERRTGRTVAQTSRLSRNRSQSRCQ
jgi:hypothetical protein